ncbi:MAG TPA: ParB/RepB/Spo0J family partition protein [Smithella sp.]|nr:ParB/RepB/Spo0J family partition protein [Smithella sp.]HRS96665.1 ParB/RepB/Spo0J family partition protein [Smithella sp.]
MAQKNVLGKGLGAIFPDLLNDTDKKKIVSCGIEELRPNRYQPRKNFNDEQQKQLIASIKHNGIIQPIVVRKLEKGYEIIAGERRWRAAQAAGLREVPVVIRDATEMQAAELSLIENIQREELNPLEEAHAYTTLMETFQLSQEDISLRVGKDRSTIANTVRLLKLPDKAKAALVEKKISSGHARCILACVSLEEQLALLELILKKNLNVRETEHLLKKAKKTSSAVKTPAKKDRFLGDLERSLATKLMAKVVINGSSSRGIIEIRYTSLDELNRLSGMILDDIP